MDKDYHQLGIETYGDRCEICGHSSIEVHHIAYHAHQAMEERIRTAVKKKQPIDELLKEATSKGYLSWDGHQLEKDNRSTNLSVLCGNCHTLIHKIDVDVLLLNALKRRK